MGYRKEKRGRHFVDTGNLERELFEPDDEVKEEFEKASRLGDSGRLFMPENIPENYSSVWKRLSGGDLDATWDQADAYGEEAVGGSTPTPDQDVVDELGEAVGLTYRDDELINTPGKIAERDRHRWEMEPHSSEDYLHRSRRKPRKTAP